MWGSCKQNGHLPTLPSPFFIIFRKAGSAVSLPTENSQKCRVWSSAKNDVNVTSSPRGEMRARGKILHRPLLLGDKQHSGVKKPPKSRRRVRFSAGQTLAIFRENRWQDSAFHCGSQDIPIKPTLSTYLTV